MKTLSLGVFAVALLYGQKSPETLTDSRIMGLVQTGVSEAELLRLVSTAPKFDFDLQPVATDAMMKVGVSEEVIKAMAARESGSSVPVSAQPVSQPRENRMPSAPVREIPQPTDVAIPALAKPSVPARRTAPAEPGTLSDAEIENAIELGFRLRRPIGLRLNDVQTSLLSNMVCETCGQSGYTITIYNPEQWIELAAQHAKREMLPFTIGDVPSYMRLPSLHVIAMPSTPDYLTGAGLSMSSSPHRVVLSDTARRTIIQPLEVTTGGIETNSAFRSATFGTASASFRMSDVSTLQSADTRQEFFIVVVGDRQNKYFKVKSKHLNALF
jgi:hypothetical protein